MINKKETVSDKKRRKENDLFDAAYDLFSTKGINDTSIDDIVKKAGVAKGTFYLYFKDKFDIINRIVLKKSFLVLEEAIKKTKEKDIDDFVESIIYFTDYIIEYFKENKILLRIINKNFSWSVVRRAYENSTDNEQMRNLIETFRQNMKESNHDDKYVEKTIFIIVDLIGSVAYSSIISGEPDSIDNMKPILFDVIRKILDS